MRIPFEDNPRLLKSAVFHGMMMGSQYSLYAKSLGLVCFMVVCKDNPAEWTRFRITLEPDHTFRSMFDEVTRQQGTDSSPVKIYTMQDDEEERAEIEPAHTPKEWGSPTTWTSSS